MAKKTLTTEQKLLIYPRVEDFLFSNETLDDNDGSLENPSIEVAQMQECLVVLGFPLPLSGDRDWETFLHLSYLNARVDQ